MNAAVAFVLFVLAGALNSLGAYGLLTGDLVYTLFFLIGVPFALIAGMLAVSD